MDPINRLNIKNLQNIFFSSSKLTLNLVYVYLRWIRAPKQGPASDFEISRKIGVLGKWNNDFFFQFLPNFSWLFLYWFTWNHLYIYCLCFTPHRIQLNPYIIKTIQIVTKNWNIDSCELPCHQYFELNFKALGCFENSKFIIKSHVCGFVICIIVCAVGRQVDRRNPQIHIGTLKPRYNK